MRKILIILGAAKPSDPSDSGPLTTEPISNTTILDWQLGAARNIFDKIIYVAGFNTIELAALYPDLTIVENKSWRDTGPVESLNCVPIEDDAFYVVQYGDVLLTSYPGQLFEGKEQAVTIYYSANELSNTIRKEKVCISNGIPMKFGYDGFGANPTYELCGVVGVYGRQIKTLIQKCRDNQKKSHLSFLAEIQRINGWAINCIPIGNQWIEVNSRKDFARQVLGTKAETLQRLSAVLKHSKILRQITVTQENWNINSKEIVRQIINEFSGSKLIVRSSAIAEDGFESAHAGVYDSVLNVGCNPTDIIESVNDVFASYCEFNSINQVLIQPMLEDVWISGVVFTRAIDTGAPYLTINYDDKTGLTDTVTGGTGESLTTLKIFKKLFDKEKLSGWLKKLLEAINEIEIRLHLDELDIEFAVNQDGEIYIFQVRPIASLKNVSRCEDHCLEKQLNIAERIYTEFVSSGTGSVFAKMPDWNPAEMIGSRPDFLSYSLYREIITDRVWAKQRFENGNIDLRGEPLMQLFCGQPYINVKRSIKSFIPAELNSEIANKIVDTALNIYRDNPSFHDKLEFEVIPTCVDLNHSKWEALYVSKYGSLTQGEYSRWLDALRQTTKFQIMKFGEYKASSIRFNDKISQIIKDQNDAATTIKKILHLLEELGTLSFAHLARCGFISVSILKSAEALNPKNKDIIEKFQTSIKTISTRFTNDVRRVQVGELNIRDFTKEYGHLRPSSYNIYSKSYRENLENILPDRIHDRLQDMSFTGQEDLKFIISDLASDLDMTPESLLSFMSEAIFWREEAKFIFSKGLSFILDMLAKVDPYLLFTKKEIHYLKIGELVSILENEISESESLCLIAGRKKQASLSEFIELPELIKHESEFYSFLLGQQEINFIGTSTVVADLVYLDIDSTHVDINEKIVMIDSADPGYDWIFGHSIAGLITEYGGANSHMAIRSAEYGIPAAIGVGTKLKQEIQGSKTVTIDCKNKVLKGR